MKIDSSAIFMQAETQRVLVAKSTVQTKILSAEEVRKLQAAAAEEERTEQQAQPEQQMQDRLNLSSRGIAADIRRQYAQANEDFRIMLLRRLLEMFTGKKMPASAMQRLETRLQELESHVQSSFSQSSLAGGGALLRNDAAGIRAVNNIAFVRVTEVYQSQSVSFRMGAVARTADGREIQVDLQMNMSSEMYMRHEERFEQLQLCDPLVVNFGAPAAALSSSTFRFDLDQSGAGNQISYLAQGSGFLAYDRNGDGEINDGGELFGTKSGDGFRDLSLHDEDGNGWVDENDAIFDKLRVWIKNEDGTDKLLALGELGIGAIFLGSVSTSYVYHDKADVNGVLRQTGVFLREDGTAGTMQHIDLKI